ncbi:hypothetical protein GP486_006312, partial [Trichoglossum hirsutum]
MSWIKFVGMKRVVEVERYVDDVVDVWIPKPRMTRRDSSVRSINTSKAPRAQSPPIHPLRRPSRDAAHSGQPQHGIRGAVQRVEDATLGRQVQRGAFCGQDEEEGEDEDEAQEEEEEEEEAPRREGVARRGGGDGELGGGGRRATDEKMRVTGQHGIGWVLLTLEAICSVRAIRYILLLLLCWVEVTNKKILQRKLRQSHQMRGETFIRTGLVCAPVRFRRTAFAEISIATMVDSNFSSPDPLANSTRTAPSTDILARRKSARLASVKSPLPSASRTPSRAASESKGAQSVQLQNFAFDTPQDQRPFGSSPTRSSIKTENHLSPWRIRVTVEAERDEEEGGGAGVGGGYLTGAADPEWKDKPSDSQGRGTVRRVRTKTTKVPLKGLESSPSPPRRRGRPKKSETPTRPRNGTPAPKTRGRRKTAEGVPKGEDNSEDPGYLTPKRLAGRPKKTPGTTKGDMGTLSSMERNGDDGALEDVDILVSPHPAKVKTTAKKPREKKKAKSPVRIAVDPDVQGDDEPERNSPEQTWGTVVCAGEEEATGDPNVNQAPPALASLSVNSVDMIGAGRLGDLALVGDEDFGEELDGPAGKFSPAKRTPAKLKRPRNSVTVNTGSASSNSVEHPADPVPLESPPAIRLSEEPQIADGSGLAIENGPRVGDLSKLDDSILESEGFSMVSISSIATAGGYAGSPIPQESHLNNVECDLVQSLSDMSLQSPSGYGNPAQRHGREGSPQPEEKWQIEMADPGQQLIAIDSDKEPTFSDYEDGDCFDGEPLVDPDMEYEEYRSRVLQDQERQLQEDCQRISILDEGGPKDLDDLFSNEDIRPRRGKIPSPWRPRRQVIYSDEVRPDDNDSGLLLQSPRHEEQQQQQQQQDRGEDGKAVGDVDDDDEDPADLSALLGLKPSPSNHPSRNRQGAGKSLRERLIDKFCWAESGVSREVAEPKRLEVKGRLILRPSTKYSGCEGGDGGEMEACSGGRGGLRGVDGLDESP